MFKSRSYRAFIIICIICAIALLLFELLYYYDNKYNTNLKTSQDGAVQLPDCQGEDGRCSEEITWMVHGWNFFPDQIIYPNDPWGESQSIYWTILQLFQISQRCIPLWFWYISSESFGKRILYHVDSRSVFRMCSIY